MELLLALAVITAVICFGALISLGNERQRRAIDELREQVVLWAIQDLRIKRERLERDVRIDDPLGWFNKIVSKLVGSAQNLRVVESVHEPPMLVCVSEDRTNKVVFTPLSPAEIRRMKSNGKSRLSQYTNQNPLSSLTGRTNAYKLTVLNVGILFDIELALAWKSLTGEDLRIDNLWMYFIEESSFV